MKIDITDINNAFSPTQEILNPKKFIGRYSEIEDGIVGLSTESSFIAIYGLRGIGKSSIAYQLKLIAEGDKTLPKIVGLSHMLPKKDFNYIVHLVRCDEFVKDIVCLIKRILFGDERNPSIFSHTNNEGKRVQSFKEKIKGEGGINGGLVKITGKCEAETSYISSATDDLIQEFRQALSVIQKDNQDKSGILILIDEFDIIENKKGFSSLIKSCSTPFIKFGVVGIGDSVEDLVEDHSSIGRQLCSIPVNVMPEEELIQIFVRAEESLRHEIIFNEETKKKICKEAEGFPYFVHLFGKEALLAAFKIQEKYINGEIFDEIKEKISNGKLKLTQEYKYVELCRTSAEREMLLKLFASSDDFSILTETIYEQAKKLGIEKPSNYIDLLRAPNMGSPVLIASKDGRHYRFSDPIFKVYAKKRNYIHTKFQ